MRGTLPAVSLLVLLGVLAVLCVAALVALGRGDRLADPGRDRSPLTELPEGDVRPEDVRWLRFSVVFRGYRMDEVDAVLDRLAEEIARRDRSLPTEPDTSGDGS